MFMLLNLFILFCYIDKCPLFIAMFLWVLLKYEINTLKKKPWLRPLLLYNNYIEYVAQSASMPNPRPE